MLQSQKTCDSEVKQERLHNVPVIVAIKIQAVEFSTFLEIFHKYIVSLSNILWLLNKHYMHTIWKQIWKLLCDMNLLQYNSCLDKSWFDIQSSYKTLVIAGKNVRKFIICQIKYNFCTCLITQIFKTLI